MEDRIGQTGPGPNLSSPAIHPNLFIPRDVRCSQKKETRSNRRQTATILASLYGSNRPTSRRSNVEGDRQFAGTADEQD
ncbi:hypothetical protein VD0003_g650 [Verticillium dahliae]|nr:hypothetical protein VD0003_g650 [Verticillium dahliae]